MNVALYFMVYIMYKMEMKIWSLHTDIPVKETDYMLAFIKLLLVRPVPLTSFKSFGNSNRKYLVKAKISKNSRC